MVHIVSSVTEFPPNYYKQEEIVQMLRKLWNEEDDKTLDRLDLFHRNVNIEGRYLAFPLDLYLEINGFGESNQLWIKAALDLGENCLCKLIDTAHIHPQDISNLTFTTVTGLAVPSIEARLMNRIPFSPHLRRVPLFGLGCMGGAAGVARVSDYLLGHPKEAAILLSIELCSLTLQRDDHSVANLVSSGLFGDGAAGVLMVGKDHPLALKEQWKVIGSQSIFFPESEYIMGYEIRDSGFKMILSADVSSLLERQSLPAVQSFLSSYGLRIEDVSYWFVHPGGPKIILALENALGLDKNALSLTRDSLSTVGNLSSASVLHILELALKHQHPEPGSYGMMMAMGPAFSAEFVLLQW